MPETAWDEIKKKVCRETALDIVWKITCGPQPNKCSYNIIPHMIPGWGKKTLLFTSRHVLTDNQWDQLLLELQVGEKLGPILKITTSGLWLLLWDGTDVSICWETSFLVLGQVRMVTLSKVNLCVKPFFPFWHLMDTLGLGTPLWRP